MYILSVILGYGASTLPLSLGPVVRIPSVVSARNYQDNAYLQFTVLFFKNVKNTKRFVKH